MWKPDLLAASLALAFATSLVACGGSGQAPTVPVAAPSDAPPETETAQVSSIEVYSKDGTEILLDGKSIGKAPIAKYEVSPGPHDVTFVDPENGNRTMGIDVAPGDHRVVTSDPVPSANDSMRPDGEKPKKK